MQRRRILGLEVVLLGSYMLILGLLILFTNHCYQVIFGTVGEKISGVLAVFLIFASTVVGGRKRLDGIVGVLMIVVPIAVLYLVFGLVRGHTTLDGPSLLRDVILMVMFCAGYSIAREEFFLGNWKVSCLLVVLIMPPVLLFLRDVNAYSYYDAGRGVGDDGVTAVGISISFAYVTVIMWYCMISSTSTFERMMFIGCLIITCMGLVSTGSRGPFVSVVGVIGLNYVIDVFVSRKVPRGLVQVVFVCLGFVVVYYVFRDKVYFFERVDNLLDRLFNSYSASGGIDTSNRMDKWQYCLERIDVWIFFGVNKYGADYNLYYPHNFILESGMRFGVLGVPVVVMVLFTNAKMAVVRFRWGGGREAIVLVFSACLCNTLINSVSGQLEGMRFVAMALGFCIGLYAKDRCRKGFAVNNVRLYKAVANQ